MEPPAGTAAPWLAELEQRVRQAVTEIGRLRQENRRLERELAKAKKMEASGDGSASWERERADVRERVERLARHLEELLGAPAADTGGAP
jgi:chromosome segregation ATPase